MSGMHWADELMVIDAYMPEHSAFARKFHEEFVK